MARKGKHRTAPPPPTELKPRIERATREGRYQQALELVKQLYKYESTPAHKELLLQVYLGRARQLRGSGYVKDAITVLNAGLQHADSNTAWIEQAALELTACGDAQGASSLLARLPEDSPERARIRSRAVDAAVVREAAGRSALAPELHADFDRIQQAFAQVQAGQDDAAAATLQPIGLRSPFLEWKVLLRGLGAYYQHDDARGLDNWQRLDPDRLPGRLAAPFRYLIDRSYREAQSPEAQAALRKQADRLQGEALVDQLRALQKALADAHSLANAFRLAEAVLPVLRQQSPQLVGRLAACFSWAIITIGRPEDVPRYSRVFGAPADDSAFARLRALAYEHAQEWESAHEQWAAFEKSVAAHPEPWAGQADRVRALVWSHMGQNAAAVPDLDDLDLPPFLLNHPERPRALKPSAEHCFEQSIKLSPDDRETHQELVQMYLTRKKPKKAEQAARRLLQHFPDDVPTLEKLAELRNEACDYAEAITLLERARQHNPLDRGIRSRLEQAHLFHARAQAEAGQFDAARAEFRTALALSEPNKASPVYCKWAACEFKAGDSARAEELLGQAVAQAGSRLAVAYSMLIEVIRMRLTKLKKRFNDEFNRLLAEPADGSTAVDLAETTAAHATAGLTYHGQKTHEKKVLGYLQKAAAVPLTEGQLEHICVALLSLEQEKLLELFAQKGRRQFPQNPFFPLYEAEAAIMLGPYRCPVYHVRPLLEEARQLAQALPHDARREALLELVQARESMLAGAGMLGGFDFGMFNEALDDMFGDEDDYEDDDW